MRKRWLSSYRTPYIMRFFFSLFLMSQMRSTFIVLTSNVCLTCFILFASYHQETIPILHPTYFFSFINVFPWPLKELKVMQLSIGKKDLGCLHNLNFNIFCKFFYGTPSHMSWFAALSPVFCLQKFYFNCTTDETSK